MTNETEISDAKDKRIAELEARNTALGEAVAYATQRFTKAENALSGMLDLFSADNVLRKGTHLNMEVSNARNILAELTAK